MGKMFQGEKVSLNFYWLDYPKEWPHLKIHILLYKQSLVHIDL